MINKMLSKLFAARHIPFVLCLAVSLTVLPSCDLAKNHLKPDRESNLEMQDYRDALAERLPEDDVDDDTSSIPKFQPYIANTSESMKSMPLVSVSVNQSVSLRDLLFELAQQADYDLELDPRIRGSIIFTARNKPFDQVVARISSISGLRYNFKDDVLRVELDEPYNEVYKIEYLSFIRKNSGSVRNDIAVVSGEGADTGSSFQATSESVADFWGDLDVALVQLLGGVSESLVTKFDPRIVATEQNPDVQAVAPASEDGRISIQPPDAILNVQSLPMDGAAGGGAPTPGADKRVSPQPSFTINKQAGMVNVFANERSHKEVAAYLKDLKKISTAQVLIETKILEVTLNDEYITGIDWQQMDLFSKDIVTGFFNQGGLVGAVSNANFPVPSSSTLSNNRNFVAGYNGNNIQALVEAISGFGTVRALASPRMTVLNNQSAILNVATNQVFFEVDIDVTTTDAGTQVDIDSDIRNVPEGVLMNVQPSINLEDRTISLALRPTITEIVNEVPDPAIQFVTAQAMIVGVESLVPELNVQEIDTVIRVNSGRAIVMGGLLQDRVIIQEEGVPILSEIPVFGALFRDHSDLVKKTELVIFIKATILDDPSDSIHNTDRDLYRKFSGDRRPFKL